MPEEIDGTLFRTLLRASLPIDEIQGVIVPDGGKDGLPERVVLIWVDDQDRPDFRNTVAAHKDRDLQQSGSFQFAWLYMEMNSNTRLLLRIEMEEPTCSVFHFGFSLKRDFGVLLTMARNRMFWVVPGPARSLPTSNVRLDVETFFKVYKREFEWMLSLELSANQATELLGFLESWPYRPGC